MLGHEKGGSEIKSLESLIAPRRVEIPVSSLAPPHASKKIEDLFWRTAM